MNKMNKKGFTLIEMLVVIAIIAVLVSIIIPIVGNSTTKAAAATDAANLRSAKATASIMVMEGTYAENDTIPYSVLNVPQKSKSDDGEFNCIVGANNQITVTYGGNNIAYYANIAAGGNDAEHTHNYNIEVKNEAGEVTGHKCACGELEP